MTIIFEVIDKTGRTIHLLQKQWSHMMLRHPYMHKYLEELKETLKSPDKLIMPTHDKGYYYRNYKHLKSPNNFILVIVKYLNLHGFVITAYLEEKIK